jgi:hypothetical protein
MQMFDGMSYATTRELVEAVVATLDLPLGLVDRAEIDRWRDGLAARGWQLDERRARHFAVPGHYRMQHRASGFWADAHVLQYDPARPQYPISSATDRADLRCAVGPLRISGPQRSELLLADANLTNARRAGEVQWMIVGPRDG